MLDKHWECLTTTDAHEGNLQAEIREITQECKLELHRGKVYTEIGERGINTNK